MRHRLLITAALLLVPAASFAQIRAPRIGGRRPGEPVPLGPQPEVVARSQRLIRSRYSVEQYPLFSRVETPGTSWTSFGTGTRLDWRLTRYMSWTFDLTSTFLGGAALTETAELGTRFSSHSWENRLRPYADVRVGFEHVRDPYAFATDIGIGPAANNASGNRYSRGFGGVLGVGAEYSLTNTFALTTGVSAMRTNMTAYRFTGVSIPRPDESFRMTTYRLTLGLKYNPVHLIAAR